MRNLGNMKIVKRADRVIDISYHAAQRSAERFGFVITPAQAEKMLLTATLQRLDDKGNKRMITTCNKMLVVSPDGKALITVWNV